MENLSGKTLGAYLIVAPLGEGGMAAVYKAYQASMERYVALKILPRHFAQDPEFLNRFQQEAKVLAKLQHPHILPIHDYGEAEGYTYIVMPLIEHGILTDLLGREPLPLSEVARIITQVGEALDYAHSHGVIHRDIKPSNILLDERGNCLLTDFGIAKMMASSANLTQTGAILGTPAYMSPEQGIGEAFDARSDIYALGVILYEMVTGRVPYKAETPIAIILKHVRDPLPAPHTLNPHIPEPIERVVLKVLAKDPNERYATAREFVQALAKAVTESHIADDKTLITSSATLKAVSSRTAKVTPAEPKAESGVGYRRLAMAFFGLIFLCCFGVGGLIMALDEDSKEVIVEDVSPPTVISVPTEQVIAVSTRKPKPPTATLAPTPLPPTVTPTHSPTPTPSPTPTTDSRQQVQSTEEPLPPTVVPDDLPPPPTRDPRQEVKPKQRGFAQNVLTFGLEGIGPGQLDDARYIGVDSAGQIYVGEYSNGRIQLFDGAGKFITQWLINTELPLMDMAVSRQGSVYIVQNSTIYRYNGQTGELLGQFNAPDGGSFQHIVAMVDGGVMATWYDMPPGNFVGTLHHNNLVHLDEAGNVVRTWVDMVSNQTESIDLDLQLAVDGLGGFYALRSGFEASVLKFSAEGKFLDKFGEYGMDIMEFQPGEFSAPQAIAVDGQQRVFVADFSNIQVFDDSGQFIDLIKARTDDMVFDEQDALYLVNRTVVKKFVISKP